MAMPWVAFQKIIRIPQRKQLSSQVVWALGSPKKPMTAQNPWLKSVAAVSLIANFDKMDEVTIEERTIMATPITPTPVLTGGSRYGGNHAQRRAVPF
jgi:hypothetical protein